MPPQDIPYELMSDAHRTFFESAASGAAARRLADLIATVEWRGGAQPRDGHGPSGRCLVAWVDSYPLAAFTDPGPRGTYQGIVSGHCSCGGSTTLGLLLNMLAVVARSPGGRPDSDSRWLRKGGKAAFFAFHGADPESAARTLAEMLPDAAPDAAPTPAP